MRYKLSGRTMSSGTSTMGWTTSDDLARESTITSCAAGVVALWRYPTTKKRPRAKGGWAFARFVVNGVFHSLRILPCPSRRGLVRIARQYAAEKVSEASDRQIVRSARAVGIINAGKKTGTVKPKADDSAQRKEKIDGNENGKGND